MILSHQVVVKAEFSQESVKKTSDELTDVHFTLFLITLVHVHTNGCNCVIWGSCVCACDCLCKTLNKDYIFSDKKLTESN